jgi:hypothetical protein
MSGNKDTLYVEGMGALDVTFLVAQYEVAFQAKWALAGHLHTPEPVSPTRIGVLQERSKHSHTLLQEGSKLSLVMHAVRKEQLRVPCVQQEKNDFMLSADIFGDATEADLSLITPRFREDSSLRYSGSRKSAPLSEALAEPLVSTN